MAIALLLLLQSPLERAVEELDADAIEVREKAERVLIEAGERARPLLESAALGRGEKAVRARRVIRRLDYAVILPPVVRAQAPGVGEALCSDDPQIRRRALFETLLRMMDAPNVQGVLHLALEDPDAALRLEAALRIEHDAGGRAGAVALDFLQRFDQPEYARIVGDRDRFWQVVSDAAWYVARKLRPRTDDVVPLLASANHYVRREAIVILCELRRWEALEHVRPLLGDEAEDVVRNAIRFMEEAGKLGAPDTYLAIAQKRDDEAAAAAARILVRLGARESAGELARLSRDKQDMYARTGLLRAAAELDPTATETEALSVEPNDAREFTAAEALAATGKVEHFDRIMSTMRKKEKQRFASSTLYARLQNAPDFGAKLARCVPRDRLAEFVDLCGEVRASCATGIEADGLAQLGWDVVPHLERPALVELCLRRLRDADLDTQRRQRAAHVLARIGLTGLSAAQLDVVFATVADPRAPLGARYHLLEALPWSRPGPLEERLRRLAAGILASPSDEFRSTVADRLADYERRAFRPVVLDAAARDPKMRLPRMWRPPDGYWPLVDARLSSGDRDLVVATLHVLSPVGAAPDCCAALLASPDVEVRRAAAQCIAECPRDAHREAVRSAAREETDPCALERCLEAIRRLGDADALSATLGRDLAADSREEWQRVRAICAIGPRERILALEERLATLPDWVAREAMTALARTDRGAGVRAVGWAIRHQSSTLRIGAVEAVRAARLEEFLPALRAMCITEQADVRVAAIRALGAFDRAHWLPAFRTALERSSYTSRGALCEETARLGATELVPQLKALLDIDPAAAASALDALVNREAYLGWADVRIGECPESLDDLAKVLNARLSDGASAYASSRIGYPGAPAGTAGDFCLRLSASALMDGVYRPIPLTHISSPGGLRIVTSEEAAAHWRAARR